MNSAKSFFSKSDPFESHQSVRRNLRISHASAHGVTHFHVDIDCHINPTGPTTSFSTQIESHHFEWCDSSTSHPFERHSFWVKIIMIFLSFTIFI
jgi:hypothetical protein